MKQNKDSYVNRMVDSTMAHKKNIYIYIFLLTWHVISTLPFLLRPLDPLLG